MKKLVQYINKFRSSSQATYALYALKINANEKYITCLLPIQNDLSAYFNGSMDFLIQNDYSKKEIVEYPIGKPKDHIEALKVDSVIIKDNIEKLNAAILSPETHVKNETKYDAYILVANLPTGEKAYFINKKNPCKTLKNSTYFSWLDNSYKAIDGHLVQLTYHFDCIIINSYSYFITLNAESLLQLTKYYERQSQSCLKILENAGVLNNETVEILRDYLKKPGKYASLSNFSQEMIGKFENLTANGATIAEEKYKLKFIANNDGNFIPDFSIDGQMEKFVEIITHKRGKDFDDNIVKTTVPFITVD